METQRGVGGNRKDPGAGIFLGPSTEEGAPGSSLVETQAFQGSHGLQIQLAGSVSCHLSGAREASAEQ